MWSGLLRGLELNRQLFHAVNGTIILACVRAWGGGVGYLLILLALLGLLLSLWHVRVRPITLAEPLLRLLEREENMGFPGKGAILYGLGTGLALVLFCAEASMAAICALAYGDAASTIAGKLLGRRPVPWNRRLSVEGSLAFVICATFFGSLWVGFAGALAGAVVGALVETLPFGDDNLNIPVITAFILSLFMCGG